MKAKQKRELKNSYKRSFTYLLLCFPVILISSIGLSALGVESSSLKIFIGVVLGGALCFIFEVVYLKRRDKKAEEDKNEPKKHDPFAD